MFTMLYSVASYLVFLASVVWAMAWVGDIAGPKTIDSGPAGSVATALVVNAALLGLFAIQHSVMARPAFKRWWTRIIPAASERSTYVLVSSLLLLVLFWQWRPLLAPIWSASGELATALTAGYWTGWLVVLLSTFMINHFDLFGLGQAWRAWQRRPPPPTAFVQRWLYRHVRHPIMLGFVIAFWCTPTMTLGHLVFALATTGYILVGTRLEERDLEDTLGDGYRDYKRRVPMLVPFAKRSP
jgi:protein-S-isoprenylcysteine O-methyltransferase Ste14